MCVCVCGGGGGVIHSSNIFWYFPIQNVWGAQWLSGRMSDSGARGREFETYLRCVVSLSKTLYSTNTGNTCVLT